MNFMIFWDRNSLQEKPRFSVELTSLGVTVFKVTSFMTVKHCEKQCRLS